MSIHGALSNGATLRWREVRGARPGWELTDGSDTLAVVRAGEVDLGDRLLRTEPQKGGRHVLVDVANRARVGWIRVLSSGPAVLNCSSGRYRMCRRGVLPFFWSVTEDIGGPQVLQILRLGSHIRIRAGEDFGTVPAGEVDQLVLLTGLRMLDLLDEPTPAAA